MLGLAPKMPKPSVGPTDRASRPLVGEMRGNMHRYEVVACQGRHLPAPTWTMLAKLTNAYALKYRTRVLTKTGLFCFGSSAKPLTRDLRKYTHTH